MNKFLFFVVGTIAILLTLSINKWKCERMDMDYDYLGCVARKNVAID